MIYVCIPAHDEAATLGVLIWKTRKVMGGFGRDFRVVVHDDASTDETPRVLARYQRVLPLTVLRSEQRIGYARSVEKLLRHVQTEAPYPKRDCAVVLQGDFSEDPEDAIALVKAIEGGMDIVSASVTREWATPPRGARIVRWLARKLLKGGPVSSVSDPLVGLRAYRVIVLKKALRDRPDPLVTSEGWAANAELLHRLAPHARRVGEVPLEPRRPRRVRPSRFRAWPTVVSLVRVRRALSRAAPAAAFAAVLFARALSVAAQGGWTAEMVTTDSAAASAPWGPGEHLVYGVKLGVFNVGQGHLTIEGFDIVRGHPTYRAVMGMKGRFTFFTLDDTYTSWFDVYTLQSWRFVRLYRGTYTSQRHYELYPERDQWDREDNDEFGPMSTDSPLDDISFIYFLRTLPLRVGDRYTFDRYFQDDGNPVVVEVLRKDRRKTDAGEFNTIVVKPTFQSDGLFSQGGNAELHFSDDERRLLVYMWVNMPRLPGGISLHLNEVYEGFPVNPASRAEVLRGRERRGGGVTNR